MNYAWAKKNKGQFIIRIEDTDQSRLVQGGEAKMLKTLQELGIIADESPIVGGPYAPYRQSERLAIYKKYALELVRIHKQFAFALLRPPLIIPKLPVVGIFQCLNEIV